MAKPLEKVIKEYTPRGPMKQFRLEKPLSFSCFRCGKSKTSKLITIYGDDWNKRLCNGCYGRLLSIYTIKSGQNETDEKVEQLSSLLLELVDTNKIREQARKLMIKRNNTKLLSAPSVKFFATSECVAEALSKESNLDWSPAIIGLCKAFELEIIQRFINPLKECCNTIQLDEADLKDKDFGRIASFCSGKNMKSPELGVICHFVLTAISSKERIEKSTFLNTGLKGYISKRPNSNWIIDSKGMVSAIRTLTEKFRNKAAHTDELDRNDYYNCRNFIFGDKGIMWDLVVSTQTVKQTIIGVGSARKLSEN